MLSLRSLRLPPLPILVAVVIAPSEGEVSHEKPLQRGNLQGKIQHGMDDDHENREKAGAAGKLDPFPRGGFATVPPEPDKRTTDEKGPCGKASPPPLDDGLEPVAVGIIPETGDPVL